MSALALYSNCTFPTNNAHPNARGTAQTVFISPYPMPIFPDQSLSTSQLNRKQVRALNRKNTKLEKRKLMQKKNDHGKISQAGLLASSWDTLGTAFSSLRNACQYTYIAASVETAYYYTNQMVNIARGSLYSIDNRISELFRFPGAEAAEISQPVYPLDYTGGSVQVADIWLRAGHNPENTDDFPLFFNWRDPQNPDEYFLPPHFKAQIEEDNRLRQQFKAFHEIYKDLKNFIYDHSPSYSSYQMDIEDSCRNLLSIESRLDIIIDHLMGKSSLPFLNKAFVLSPPRYIDDIILSRPGSLRDSEGDLNYFLASPGHGLLTFDIQEKLFASNRKRMNGICHASPMEHAILAYLADLGDLPKEFDVNNGISKKQFDMLFSDETFKKLKKHIDILKFNLVHEVLDMSKIIRKYVKAQFKEIQTNIDNKIDLFYKTNANIAQANGFDVIITAKKGDLVQGWDIMQPTEDSESILAFRFKILSDN